ncbi:diguanylate cyclase [Neobacillus mesonae]|nr:diguanylate cyclase [Neobacillus mesonae]
MTEHLHESSYKKEGLLLEIPEQEQYDRILEDPQPIDRWLDYLDVNIFDAGHIERILKEAFEEWYSYTVMIPSLNEALFSVWNRDNACLVSKGEILSPIEEAVTRAVDKGLTEIVQHQEHSGVAVNSEYEIYTIPLHSRKEKKLLGVICIGVLKKAAVKEVRDLLLSTKYHFQSCFYRRFEQFFLTDMLHIHKLSDNENRRRSILLQIVQRMQDKMDVQAVLEEVFDSVAFLFPAVGLTLYMSQDGVMNDPRVKPLYLHGDIHSVCVRAFTEERIISQPNAPHQYEIGIPFRGKQGTYGVFHIEAKEELVEDVDLKLITMMADTAGTAYENAKLHEQSGTLIQELRMIDELTKRLNQSLQLADIYEYAVHQLIRIFKAESCCILKLDPEDQLFHVMFSNIPSLKNEKFSLSGISGKVYRSGEPFILFDYENYTGPGSFFMDTTGSMSMMAVPLRISGKVEGTVLVAHQKKQFFSYNNFRFLDMLAVHIGLAATNATLHAEVERLATVDALTGLYVRHYVDRMIEERQNTDFCGALMVIDIDQFKQVNDRFGHQVGDTVLKQVGNIIRNAAGPNDLCARWGGEEIAIYLPQVSSLQSSSIAETIRQQVPKLTSPSITVSIGIGEWCWLDDQVSLESLFYRADMALYEAKNSGRDRIVIETKTKNR